MFWCEIELLKHCTAVVIIIRYWFDSPASLWRCCSCLTAYEDKVVLVCLRIIYRRATLILYWIINKYGTNNLSLLYELKLGLLLEGRLQITSGNKVLGKWVIWNVWTNIKRWRSIFLVVESRRPWWAASLVRSKETLNADVILAGEAIEVPIRNGSIALWQMLAGRFSEWHLDETGSEFCLVAYCYKRRRNFWLCYHCFSFYLVSENLTFFFFKIWAVENLSSQNV
jgi:hypothetical protein